MPLHFRRLSAMLDTILRPVALPPHLLGLPAPCDFFDARGTLLVKAGIPISPRAGQLPSSRRLFCRASQARRISPADPLAQLARLGKRLALLSEQALIGEVEDEGPLLALAHEVGEIWALDADACLGYARLAPFASPCVRQVVLAALLAAELATANGMPEPEVLALVGAALTMNLSSMALHDEMHALAKEPDQRMRDELDLHPLGAAALLRRIGHFPPSWLNAVAQHHENVDGSGYPWGLRRAEITLAARILRVADTLAARMIGRKHRPPRHWNLQQVRDLPHLMKHVFGADLKLLDPTLVRLLMGRLGAFAPGTLLHLHNGEIAVIGRRSAEPLSPPRAVLAVMGRDGQALEAPRWREIGARHHRIRGYANDDMHRWPAYDWPVIWGYGHFSV